MYRPFLQAYHSSVARYMEGHCALAIAFASSLAIGVLLEHFERDPRIAVYMHRNVQISVQRSFVQLRHKARDYRTTTLEQPLI